MKLSAVIIAVLLVIIAFLLGTINSQQTDAQADSRDLRALLGVIQKASAHRNTTIPNPVYTITINSSGSPTHIVLAYADGRKPDAYIKEIGTDFVCLQDERPNPMITTCVPLGSILGLTWD